MKSQLRLPFYLAWQYIRRGRKWTLILTFFLMAVAFINLLFVCSLLNGIIEGTNHQIIDKMTGNIYVAPLTGSEYISNKTDVLKKIGSLEGVNNVSAQTVLPGRLEHRGVTGAWQILAINPANEDAVTSLSKSIIDGSYLDENDENGIILGRQIAGGEGVEKNAFSFKGVKAGDKVNINMNNKSYEFIIRGVSSNNFVTADERAFITEKALKKMMPTIDDKTSTVLVKIQNEKDEEKVIAEINGANIGGNVYTWREVAGIMKSIGQSFASINIIMTFVGVLIAAVTIFIVIYMDIINKKRQIGILRAIGIKPYIIISSYVILSAVYAVIGLALGTALFFLILVPYFDVHPFELTIVNAVLVLNKIDFISRAEIVMWVAVISGLIPAAVVTRTKMLDAILGR